MHQNPDYAKLFRGRPLRFVLPLIRPKSNTSAHESLILDTDDLKIKNVRDRVRGKKRTKSKRTKAQVDFKNKKQRDILKRKSAAFRLTNGQIFVKPELLCELGCETPRINYESKLGKEYQYFYAMSSDVDIENPGTVSIF